MLAVEIWVESRERAGTMAPFAMVRWSRFAASQLNSTALCVPPPATLNDDEATYRFRPLGRSWSVSSYAQRASEKPMHNTESPIRTTNTIPDDVAAVFESYPVIMRAKLLALRQLILDTASATEGVGEIEEALRWGEPSYLTTETKSGSTIRISIVRGTENQYAVYFNCQTTLVATFRQMYPNLFAYSGNRAIMFHVNDTVPTNELGHCIALALCYHLDKK